MTQAEVKTRLEVNSPTEEVVVLEVDDGETYISKKFSTVTAVQATLNEDTADLTIPISCAISGGTVTIHGTGISSDTICLTLYGRK